METKSSNIENKIFLPSFLLNELECDELDQELHLTEKYKPKGSILQR